MPVAEWLHEAFTRTSAMLEQCRKTPLDSGGLLGASRGLGGVLGIGDESESAAAQLGSYVDWVYTSIRPIAQRIAGQKICVGRKTKALTLGAGRGVRRRQQFALVNKMPRWLVKQASEIELLDAHPLLDVFDDPNDLQVPWSLLYSLVVNLEATGIGYWLLTKKDGRDQIWTVPTSWVTPIHDDASNQFFARYKVQAAGGRPLDIDGANMLCFAYPDPANPLAGYGPLAAQSRAVQADRAIQTAQVKAFENGIFPAIALIAGEIDDMGQTARPALEADQRKQLTAAITDSYRGLLRYGEPIILDAIIRDIKKITNSPQEMDFLNSGLQTKARIMQGFGVNPIITGQVESASRAASAEADKHFCKSTVNPKIELLSQVLTGWLGPKFAAQNERLCVWIEPATTDDGEELRANIDLLSRSGNIGRKEMRGALGFDPEIDPDDIVGAPFSLVFQPAGELGAWPPPPPPALPPEDTSETANTGKSLRGARGLSGLSGRLSRQVYEAAWLKLHGQRENELRRSVGKVFQEQAQSIRARLQKLAAERGDRPLTAADADWLASALFDPEAWHAQLKQAIEPHLVRAAVTGASLELSVQSASRWRRAGRLDQKDTERLVEIPDDVMDAIRSEIQTALRQPYLADINRTSRRRLRDLLAQKLDEGVELRDIASSIVAQLGASSVRALGIARTETTGALNAGHHFARQDLIDDGLIAGSQWIDMGDPLVRDTHAAVAGTVIGAGEQFDVGGYPAPYPGHYSLPAEERCGCRCTTVASGSFADGEHHSDHPSATGE